MAILFLSISYVSLCQWLPYGHLTFVCQWLPYGHLTFVCQWLPYGHLTFVYVSDSYMATLRFSVSDSHMATLRLSMSVTPKWPPYVSLCQWLPYGHLTFVYVSDSHMATLRLSMSVTPKFYICLSLSMIPKRTFHFSMTPKWTPYIRLYRWLPNGRLILSIISDFIMATLCFSLSVTPKEVPWILDPPPENSYAAQK